MKKYLILLSAALVLLLIWGFAGHIGISVIAGIALVTLGYFLVK